MVYGNSGGRGVDFGSLWGDNGDTWEDVDKSGDKLQKMLITVPLFSLAASPVIGSS